MRLLLTASLAVMSISFPAFSCSCDEPPPPCQAVGQSELVFIGTITHLESPARGPKTASMKIDHAFKGELKETESLFDDGMCDGPRLEVGRQYLMYTRRSSGGSIPARGCTRSRSIKYADEDLAYLKKYSSGKVSTNVSGTVQIRPDQNQVGGLTPLKDVLIRIVSGEKQFETTTDSLGKYSVSDLPVGDYSIEADLSGYRGWSRGRVSVQPKGCAVADFFMSVDRRIQGVIRDSLGMPAPGALVEMIPAQPGAGHLNQPILLGVSDDEGRYEINAVPPGEYFLGTNVKSTPTKYHPYPRVFYPGVSDSKEAIVVIVGQAAATRDYDLRVPGKLPLIEIQGRILKADGNPPSPEDRAEVMFKEPGLNGQIEELPIRIDSDGRFQFELCEGVAYSAFAFAGSQINIYSTPLEFLASKENRVLTFILSKAARITTQYISLLEHYV